MTITGTIRTLSVCVTSWVSMAMPPQATMESLDTTMVSASGASVCVYVSDYRASEILLEVDGKLGIWLHVCGWFICPLKCTRSSFFS